MAMALVKTPASMAAWSRALRSGLALQWTAQVPGSSPRQGNRW